MTDEPRDDFEGFEDEVVVPVEDSIDLHAFRPRDVKSVVEAYLDAAREKGLSEVRIVHGKGIGVQREIVRGVLRRHPGVVDFRLAPEGAGSWGATVAVLRPLDEDRSRIDLGDGGDSAPDPSKT